jgi:cyclase
VPARHESFFSTGIRCLQVILSDLYLLYTIACNQQVTDRWQRTMQMPVSIRPSLSVSIKSIVISSIFLCGASRAQNDFTNVVITPVPVAGNVTMLMGQGGNIAVSIGEDGVLMVDDQYAPLSDRIKAAISSLGGDAPTFLVNTHWHGDHTGGNEFFSDAATIIAQDNVRVRMADPANKRVPESVPVITYQDGISIHFNGEEIRLFHLPNGHTDGDSAVWFKGSNVLHMGDQFFAIRYPYVDLDSKGNVHGLIRNLNNLVDQLPDDIMIIPGHGNLSTKADFLTYIDGVNETAAMVLDRKAAGLSLQQIIDEGLPEAYASWGAGFISEEAWITEVYKSQNL